MGLEDFTRLIGDLTAELAGRALDDALANELNRRFPPDGAEFRNFAAACRQGVAEGWLCNREAGGLKYGRVIKAGPGSHGFSVDVVDMAEIAGPYHAHPNGEIDLVMPLDPAATFDGHGAGWVVYGPGTAHRPTVASGRAIVLYLLPGGAIDFNAAA